MLVFLKLSFALQAFIRSFCILHVLDHLHKLSLSLLQHLIQQIDIWTHRPLFNLLVDFLQRRIVCHVFILKWHSQVDSSTFLRFQWHDFFRSNYLTPQWSRQNVGVKFLATIHVKAWLDSNFDSGSNLESQAHYLLYDESGKG